MFELKDQGLDVLKKFVQSFPYAEWYKFSSQAEYEALIKMLVTRRKNILCESDAKRLCESVIYEVIATEQLYLQPAISPKFIQSLQQQLFDKLKLYIESLPRKYYIRIPIPNFPDWGKFSIEISPNIKIVSDNFNYGDSDSTLEFKATLAELLDPRSELKTYLEIQARGFIPPFADSPKTAEVLSVGKQCAFLLTTYGLMSRSYYNSPRAYITTDQPESLNTFQLPSSVASSFGLSLNERKLLIYDDPRATILTDQGRPARTATEKIAALSSNLHPLRNYFSKVKHPDFQSISAAIEWYQDSLYADNQTFSYLAACIGLEALLGTRDFMDMMSKRLSDRFATLMGKGKSERNKLAEEYLEVLSLRGEIVHAKEARLTAQHQKYLSKVQGMLSDVIHHELAYLFRDGRYDQKNEARKRKS